MKFIPLGIGGDLSGSMGGVTASRNRFGQYFRQKSIPVNPRSDRQSVNRSRFSGAVVNWFGLTEAQRIGWSVYADNVPFSGSLGGTYNLTGQEMYLRTYTAMLAAGLTPVSDAPTIFNLGDVDPTIVITDLTASATGDLEVSFDDALDWTSEDGAALVVSLARPFSFSRKFNNGPYRIVGTENGDSVTPATSPASFTGINAGTYQLSVGNQTRVRARIIRADGRVSTPFFTPFFTIL